MLWQFFSLPGIENGIEYRYFSRYRIEVRNSSIVTTLLGWVHDFKYLSKGCRKRAVLWKGCRFKALRNIWSSEEDLHFCNDSISADVTNILFWQMLSYPWLTTTYCYFRRYYIVRWNNTTTQIQLVTYKSPIKWSTWSWNKKKKDHLTVQRCFVSKA